MELRLDRIAGGIDAGLVTGRFGQMPKRATQDHRRRRLVGHPIAGLDRRDLAETRRKVVAHSAERLAQYRNRTVRRRAVPFDEVFELAAAYILDQREIRGIQRVAPIDEVRHWGGDADRDESLVAASKRSIRVASINGSSGSNGGVTGQKFSSGCQTHSAIVAASSSVSR